MNSLFTFLVLLLVSCTNAPVNDVTASDDTLVPITEPIDPPEVVVDPFADSLRAYFANPCDFYALKKETMHMHSGGLTDVPDNLYHQVNDPDAILYAYWAIEFDLRTDMRHRSLSFAVQKPWATAVQKYYETDNETLVGIRCRIAWEHLGPSNFVGMHIDSIKAKFGEPHAVDDRYSTFYNSADPNGPKDKINTTSIYFQDDHLLLLNEKNQKVNWFKYFWWHENIPSVDALPEAIFEWNELK